MQKLNQSLQHTVTIILNFQQERKSIQFNQNLPQHLRILYDEIQLKKQILTTLGYSSKDRKNIRLEILEFWDQTTSLAIPIHNAQNWISILNRLFKKKKKIIKLNIVLAKPLVPIKKIRKITIGFKQDGSIEQYSQEDKMVAQIIHSIMPTQGLYTGQCVVRCAFCGKSSKDKKSIKILGPLFGPFLKKRYAHIICAIWCSKVYVNSQTGALQNVDHQIEMAMYDKCYYCHKKGAGLLCHSSKDCGVVMHYECGLEECEFDWETYTFLCAKCNHKPEDDEVNMDEYLIKEDLKQI